VLICKKKGDPVSAFLKKMAGGSQSPPGVDFSEIAWSWVGAFLGMMPVALLQYNFFPDGDLVFLIGSFGASAVLIYGAVRSPLAQPRNLVGGHLISAVIGVAAWQLLGSAPWLAAAFAVATAIAAMHATRTLHPPGGATALIAVIGSDKIHNLGLLYVVFPVATGVVIMLIVALVVNNIAGSRKYPEFWW
jgi:CBS-domain-containing membrane protein